MLAAMPTSRNPIPGLEARRPALFERLLGLFTEVHPGEGPTALLLMLDVFLLLTAYYFIKPVREALILQGGPVDIFGWTVGKAELKSYASAVMAALLVLVVRAYGKLASAVPRHQLITLVTLFFIGNLAIFYGLAAAAGPSPWLGVAFFLWVGIFNVMVVAQFWSFANDVYRPEEGTRLFPIVAFGASAGAVAGSAVASPVIRALGVPAMLPAAAAILGISIALTRLVHRREVARRRDDRGPRPGAEPPEAATAPVGKEGGFKLVLGDRYLLAIALLVLVANVVNTTGEFLLSKKVAQAAAALVSAGAPGGEAEGQFIGQFYSRFYLWVNTLGLLMQLFLVSRLLKYLGLKVALMMLPAVALGAYTVLAFGAALGAVRLAKILENSTDYSVQNTTRNVLFLPTTREVKYKAKAVIDTFFQRLGDFGSALLVFSGTAAALSVERFALINALLVVAWIALAAVIVRGHARLVARAAAEGSPAAPPVGP